jgi:protein-S-isoprenylcysteine O-methyltransferase Ste14
MYTRLALREESEVRTQFPSEYATYAESVPRFFPRLFSTNIREPKTT